MEETFEIYYPVIIPKLVIENKLILKQVNKRQKIPVIAYNKAIIKNIMFRLYCYLVNDKILFAFKKTDIKTSSCIQIINFSCNDSSIFESESTLKKYMNDFILKNASNSSY